MEDLKGKVAVVFAASGEIAGAVARSFANIVQRYMSPPGHPY